MISRRLRVQTSTSRAQAGTRARRTRQLKRV